MGLDARESARQGDASFRRHDTRFWIRRKEARLQPPTIRAATKAPPKITSLVQFTAEYFEQNEREAD
jgi:hypothetical protein